jgi:hypothetical protein
MPIKISSLDLSTTITASDLLQIIDVEDPTTATGKNKKVTAQVAANSFADLLTSVPGIIQTELDTKLDATNPQFSGTIYLPEDTYIGDITPQEIKHLDGVTADIQTQLNAKISSVSPAFTGTVTSSNTTSTSLTSGALWCNGINGAILLDSGAHKRISWNDGDGHFNIRAGHFYNGSARVYAKSPGSEGINDGGAAKITLTTDATPGEIEMSVAVTGVPGAPVIWANNLTLTKDYLHTDRAFGVGVSTPASPIEVIARTTTNDPDKNGICVYNSGTSSNNNAVIAAITNGENSGDPIMSWNIKGVAGWSAGIDNSDSDAFKISSRSNDIATDTRITILNDGRVGIGKSNPATALDVNGTITATTFSGSFSGSFTGNSATSTLAAKASTLASGGANGTAMTFSYSSQSGQPTWLWGTNDGISTNTYNPSNFNVAYATSAGNGLKASGAISWSGNNSTTNPSASFEWSNLNNVSSITWIEKGVYKITFSNAMTNNRYAVVANINLDIDITSATYDGDNWYDGEGSGARYSMKGNEAVALATNKTTTHFYIVIHSPDGNTLENTNGFAFMVF